MPTSGYNFLSRTSLKVSEVKPALTLPITGLPALNQRVMTRIAKSQASIEFKLYKPDGSVAETQNYDAATCRPRRHPIGWDYVYLAAAYNVVGVWRYRLKLTLGIGSVHYSDYGTITVTAE